MVSRASSTALYEWPRALFSAMPFLASSPDGERRKFLIALGLNHHGPAATLGRLDAEEHRRSPRSPGAVDHNIYAASVRDHLNYSKRILFRDVNNRIRAKGFGNLQPPRVFARAL